MQSILYNSQLIQIHLNYDLLNLKFILNFKKRIFIFIFKNNFKISKIILNIFE